MSVSDTHFLQLAAAPASDTCWSFAQKLIAARCRYYDVSVASRLTSRTFNADIASDLTYPTIDAEIANHLTCRSLDVVSAGQFMIFTFMRSLWSRYLTRSNLTLTVRGCPGYHN